jgi:hypothetical protein
MSCYEILYIQDIIHHSEDIARIHIRIMSVTLIFVSFRLLKVGRIINEEFGSLVVILTYAVNDILIWVIAYFTLLIPFSKKCFINLNLIKNLKITLAFY